MSKEKYLHDAVKKIVATYGKSLYYNKRMINYISDYYNFDPLALYNVMKTLISDGYAGKLIDANNSGDWKLFVTQSIAKVQKNYGFAPIYVNYCFQCLAYGIGLYPIINKRLLAEIEGRSPIPPSNSPTPSPGHNPPSIPQSKKSTPKRKSSSSSTTQRTPSFPQSNRSGTQAPFPQSQRTSNNTNHNKSQKQPNIFTNGCGCSGCFDGMTNTYVIIIIILWIITQCQS